MRGPAGATVGPALSRSLSLSLSRALNRAQPPAALRTWSIGGSFSTLSSRRNCVVASSCSASVPCASACASCGSISTFGRRPPPAPAPAAAAKPPPSAPPPPPPPPPPAPAPPKAKPASAAPPAASSGPAPAPSPRRFDSCSCCFSLRMRTALSSWRRRRSSCEMPPLPLTCEGAPRERVRGGQARRGAGQRARGGGARSCGARGRRGATARGGATHLKLPHRVRALGGLHRGKVLRSRGDHEREGPGRSLQGLSRGFLPSGTSA